jgi:hypothetical protein
LDSGGSGLCKHRRPVAMHLLLDLGQSCASLWRLDAIVKYECASLGCVTGVWASAVECYWDGKYMDIETLGNN